MADDDRSLIDRAKEALGIGRDKGDERDQRDRYDDERDEMERPIEDPSPHRDESLGGISGATQASGHEGASGGTGASAAMGGAGAAGPTGAMPEAEEPTTGAAADPGRVRTEYEMGHEVDPDHEARAESGASRQRGSDATGTRGEAASGRSPFDEDDDEKARDEPVT